MRLETIGCNEKQPEKKDSSESSANDENLASRSNSAAAREQQAAGDESEVKCLRVMMELVSLFFSGKFKQGGSANAATTEVAAAGIIREFETPVDKVRNRAKMKLPCS